MKKFISLILLIASFCTFGLVHAQDDGLRLRGGTLTITEAQRDMSTQYDVKVNGKVVHSDGYKTVIEKTFAVGESDIVLLGEYTGGTACPVQFRFLTVTTEGATKLTPQFGTCSDLIKPSQKGKKIIVKMPEMNGKNATYTLTDGMLKKNGKPHRDGD